MTGLYKNYDLIVDQLGQVLSKVHKDDYDNEMCDSFTYGDLKVTVSWYSPEVTMLRCSYGGANVVVYPHDAVAKLSNLLEIEAANLMFKQGKAVSARAQIQRMALLRAESS